MYGNKFDQNTRNQGYFIECGINILKLLNIQSNTPYDVMNKIVFTDGKR